MGPAVECKEKPSVDMEVRAGMENVGGVVTKTEDVLMPCVSLYEDRGFFDQSNCGNKAMSLEVNIVDGPLTNSDARQEEVVHDDVTESTSSFGGSGSENDNGLGDAEVESQLRPDLEPESVFDFCGTSFGMRKRRLTEEWKSFIRPVMWRCKWIELQLKEFQTQALKYDRELAEHEQQKQFEFGTFLAEGRTTNGNLDVGFHGWDPIESEGSDGEEIFKKIEAVQLLVRSLRTRIDNVVSEIPKKFSSVNILSSPAPADPPSSSNPVPSSALPNGKEQILIHNQAAKEDMRDLRNFGCRLKEEHLSSLENQPRQAMNTGSMIDSLETRMGFGGKSLPKSRSEFPMTIRSQGRKRTIVGKRGKKS